MGADGVKVLVPTDPKRLDARYLFWFLITNEVPSAGYSRHYKFLKRLDVPLPPLDEQRRIAAILDKADALRQKRKHAIALLDGLTQSIFLEMFGDPIHNPKAIPTRPVGAICTLLNGAAFKPSDWSDEGRPIIRIQNLNDASKSFNLTKRELNPRLWIRPGDYLFSWSGTPGTSFGCFNWQGPEGWLNQHIFKVGLVSDVLGDFFLHQMNVRMHELIAKAHGGVGLQHVTKGMIEEMVFLCPPIEEQRHFVTLTRRIREMADTCSVALNRLDQQFLSLQHRAFSGQL
jgi:restriction endonuclease S subunit